MMRSFLCFTFLAAVAVTVYGCSKCRPLEFDNIESTMQSTRKVYVNVSRDGVPEDEHTGVFSMQTQGNGKAELLVYVNSYVDKDGERRSPLIFRIANVPYSGKVGDTVFSLDDRSDLKFDDLEYENVPVVITGTLKNRSATRCSPVGPERIFAVKFAVRITLPVEDDSDTELIVIEFDDYKI